MEITCPACAKKNEDADSCVRCGCDLTMLRTIMGAALAHLDSAASELRHGDWAAALGHAERSWTLVHSPESARVACLAAVALGEQDTLDCWRRRAAANPS